MYGIPSDATGTMIPATAHEWSNEIFSAFGISMLYTFGQHAVIISHL